jgi:5-methylcytosine-specific restriction endonuclease McrA
MLRHRSADSREADPPTTTEGDPQHETHVEFLERGMQDSVERSATEGHAATLQGQLGIRAEIETDGTADEMEINHSWCELRPSEVVRLINSTPLGPVINDRQLYRHRQRAPWIQSGSRRIDLVRYVAWLVAYRRRKTRRRRRVCGREVLSLEDLRELLHQQNFRCALTGERLTPTNFALDHIVPIADGGEFTAANSQLVLKSVNRAKNTMSEEEFIEMCRKVARYRQDVPAARVGISDATNVTSQRTTAYSGQSKERQ